MYSDKVIDRVKERIDDVKIEVLNALQSCICATLELRENSMEMDLKAQTSVVRQMSMGEDLKAKQPIVIKALLNPMKSKNMKVKVAAIETLSSYALLSQFNFDLSFGQVWPHLKTTIDDDSHFEPAISSLGVMRRMFRSKELSETRKGSFTEVAPEITAFLKKAIEHNYSKVVFEGLRVASSFLNALRSPTTGTVDQSFAACVTQLNTIILEKLGRVNIDTEVKHCCLLTASSLISTAHPILGDQVLDQYYDIFADRLDNELTRDAALKGLTMIAANSLVGTSSAPLIPISNPAKFLPLFFDLLKKQQRQLHLNTLEAMEALTSRYSGQLSSHAQSIQNEVQLMIADSDL